MDIDLLIKLSALLIGIVILVYIYIFKIKLAGISSLGGINGDINRIFNLPALITLILALIVTFFIIKKLPSVHPTSFFLAWLFAYLLLLIQSSINKKLYASDGTKHVFNRYNMSIFSTLAISLILVASGPLSNISDKISVENTYLIMALGLWLPIFYYSLISAMYVELRDNYPEDPYSDAYRYDAGSHSISSETLMMSVLAITVSIAIAGYRFDVNAATGYLYPIGIFTGSVLMGVIIIPVMKAYSYKPVDPIAKTMRWLAVIIYLAGTGSIAFYFSNSDGLGVSAFFSFAIGLLVSIIIYAFVSWNKSKVFSTELSIAVILLLIAASVLSFRWMAGYGASLCAIGFMASLPLIIQLYTFKRNQQMIRFPERNLTEDVYGGVEIFLSSGAFLIIITLLRLFTERMDISISGIDITEPYSLIGLVSGGVFPLAAASLLKSMCEGAKSHRSAKPVIDKLILVNISLILIITVLVSVGIIFFWRMKAAGGFIAGLAISELFIIFLMLLTKTDPILKFSDWIFARVTHLITVGSALIITISTEFILNITGNFTRANKILILMGLLFIIFISVFIIVIRKANMITDNE